MHFFFWLLENKVDCLTNFCVSLLLEYKYKSKSKDVQKIISESKKDFIIHLQLSNETPTLHLKKVTAKLYMTYLIQLRNRTTLTFYGCGSLPLFSNA